MAACLILVACGGEGGVPTAPVDNSVARVDITPSAAASLTSGATTTLSATAYSKDNRALSATAISWSSSNDATASVTNGVVTARIVGSATITATSGGVNSAGVAVTVVAGPPAQLAVRAQPDGAASGVALTTQPVIEVRDAAGNLVSTSAAVVTVAIASGGGTVAGTSSVTATAGVATFSGLAVAGTIGARTFTFTAVGLSPATSAPFTLVAGVAAQLALRLQPDGAASGSILTTQPVVEVRDASGNVSTTSTAVVTAAVASGGGTLGGTATATASGGVGAFTGLSITGTIGARTMTFSAPGLTAMTSAPFTLVAGAATQLAVRIQPVGAASGATLLTQPVVEMRDGAGNLTTSSTAPVTVGIGSGGGTLSGTTTVTAIASVATFAGLSIAGLIGARTLVFSAPGLVTATSAPFTLGAGAPAQIGLRTQPDGAASGVSFVTQPVIEIRDAAGNVVTTSTIAVTTALASGGGTLAGTSTASASGGIATFSGLAIAGTIGARTLTFTSTGLTAVTSAPFTLSAGAAAQLAVRTQPVAGTAYVAFVTPAVVEIRDASGNLTTSTAPVTAAIASGGGTIGAAATVNAVAGVATFASLTVNGTAGPRTLNFTSIGIASATSASFNVAAAPPSIIALSPTTLTLNATVGQNPAASSVAITNTGVFPLTNLRVQSISYSSGAAGWLGASLSGVTDAPTTLRLTLTSASLALGSYSATVVVAGDGASSTASLTVSLAVVPVSINAFGTSTNKVSIVNSGSSITPGFVTKSGTGAVIASDPTIAFVTRSPAIATVDATGRITAVAQGQTWVAATSTTSNSDSVLVIVPRATGPILRTDATTFAYRVGDTVTVRVQLDTRGASVGAITATVTWPIYTITTVYGVMTLVDVNTSGSPLATVSAVDPTLNLIRLNGASAAGLTGLVQLAVVRFVVRQSGATGIYLNASELLASDFTNLLPLATFVLYPVIAP